MYRVYVDETRCQGHARCLVFAPEVFEFDDEGYSFVPEERSRFAEVTEDVQRAVTNCPERAIYVEDDQKT